MRGNFCEKFPARANAGGGGLQPGGRRSGMVTTEAQVLAIVRLENAIRPAFFLCLCWPSEYFLCCFSLVPLHRLLLHTFIHHLLAHVGRKSPTSSEQNSQAGGWVCRPGLVAPLGA